MGADVANNSPPCGKPAPRALRIWAQIFENRLILSLGRSLPGISESGRLLLGEIARPIRRLNWQCRRSQPVSAAEIKEFQHVIRGGVTRRERCDVEAHFNQAQ